MSTACTVIDRAARGDKRRIICGRPRYACNSDSATHPAPPHPRACAEGNPPRRLRGRGSAQTQELAHLFFFRELAHGTCALDPADAHVIVRGKRHTVTQQWQPQ